MSMAAIDHTDQAKTGISRASTCASAAPEGLRARPLAGALVGPVFIFLPLIPFLAGYAFDTMRTWQVIVLIVAGTRSDGHRYWLHRIVFWAPDEGVGAAPLMIHGPSRASQRPKRLVMPPSASLPLAALFCMLSGSR
jgi:hypothetical protein